ncbi:hypothetical protein HPP92_016766 [Vanilla planifolia]|uniref:Uncharacterized protein n=1 Tax=Vanilla planifolia TaxID=51239 RepID=A0A835USF9_VANPL|nr:hypothetical protein HPP92_016766 [Vanilla planifolia]
MWPYFSCPCIDPWLRAHLNCPLCRTQIASASSAAYPISDGDGALINSATEWNAQTSDQRNSEEEEEDGERFIETVAVTGFSTDYTSSSASSCGGDLHENGLLLELECDSLGTTLGRNLTLSMTGEGRFDQKINLELVKQASSSGEGFLQKNSLQLGGGTTSASGRILLFQKYGRSRSSSVLPL